MAQIKNYLFGTIIFEYEGSIEKTIKKAAENGISIHYADFRGMDLHNINLSGLNLYGANFSGANCQNANFSGANLNGSCFYGTDLRGANFENAFISDWHAANMLLARANFENAIIGNKGFYDKQQIVRHYKMLPGNSIYQLDAIKPNGMPIVAYSTTSGIYIQSEIGFMPLDEFAAQQNEPIYAIIVELIKQKFAK